MVRKNANVDGGYAWVVLAALFTVDLLIGMLWTTVGLLTTAIVEDMDEDITNASVVGSTLLGTSTLFGPVSGLLHDRLGHRWTGVVSGVLMLVGLTSASFCTSVTGLICTFGLITGLGASLGTNLSGVAPGSYFVKKLSIAYGITQVGGGFGLFLVGPLVLFLLDNYQLSGTLLILGAIMFNVSLAGALIRPNTVIKDEEKSVELEANSETRPDDTGVEERDHSTYMGVVETDVGSPEALAEQSPEPDVDLDTCSSAVIRTPPGSHRKSIKSDEKANSNDEAVSEPLIGTKLTANQGLCFGRCLKLIVRQLRTIFLVLRSNGFYIYLLSSVFWTLGDSSSMLHLPNYAESKGSTPSQISNLLTAMGVTVILSSVLSGFAVSDPVIGNILLNFGCLGMAGMLTVLFPLYSHSYFLQMVYSALYCVYSQAPYTLSGPICIQLVGVTNLGLGYGLSAFFTGLGYLFGPPIASLLYESSGLYDLSYVFAGCCLLVAALLIALVPMFEKQQGERQHT